MSRPPDRPARPPLSPEGAVQLAMCVTAMAVDAVDPLLEDLEAKLRDGLTPAETRITLHRNGAGALAVAVLVRRLRAAGDDRPAPVLWAHARDQLVALLGAFEVGDDEDGRPSDVRTWVH